MTYIIGQDLDGCAYHFDRTMRYMLRRWYKERGVPGPWELGVPSQSWDGIQKAILPEAWKWLWSDAVEEGLFRYGHVVGGSIEGVQALSEIGDVVIITSRPKQAVSDTFDWLSHYFNKVPVAGIHILSHGQKKSEVMPRPNIYIDDATHNMDDILTETPAHVKAVLFDQPWNMGYLHEQRKRYKRGIGWDETVRLVREAKEGKW